MPASGMTLISRGALDRGTVLDQRSASNVRGDHMGLILAIILILLLLAVIPAWPYSRGWGPAPGGIIGTILIIVLVLWLLGAI